MKLIDYGRKLTRDKSSKPGCPFSFEPMVTDSENVTASGDSTVR